MKGPVTPRGLFIIEKIMSAEEKSMRRILPAAFLLLLTGACTPTHDGTTTRSPRDVLTAEEIASTNALNAYEAISLKRPFFLKSRGPRSLRQAPVGQTTEFPVVYVDKMYYGELESLRYISINDIKEIQYLDFNEATLRFGTGHSGGIILVLTKGGNQ
jgi:hypothetical protein